MADIQNAYNDKIRTRFATIDRNHDGKISVEDFESMAHTTLTSVGHTPESAKGRTVLEGARAYFAGLAGVADTDNDGIITESEFVSAAESRLRGNAEGFAAIARPWAEAVAAAADVNDDGVVDVAEWEQMLLALGATAPRAAEQARLIDTDGDGRVSVEEVLVSIADFYTGDDYPDVFDQG